jgi:hypothetical protein
VHGNVAAPTIDVYARIDRKRQSNSSRPRSHLVGQK